MNVNRQGACHLCPRECGADRSKGERGYCGAGEEPIVARAALHMWEEPCISGSRGSGAVFFSGCQLRCVSCQNHDIALMRGGTKISTRRLADIFLELEEQGAHNINLVTPTHFIHSIKEALVLAKSEGLGIPIVFNTGGYDKAGTLRELDGLVDIYLPDMKYHGREAAKRYSNAPDYFEVAARALQEMVRQTEGLLFEDDGSEDGLMKRGVIVRHLLLPGGLEDSKAVVRYLYETYGDRIYMSLLNQYTPMPQVRDRFPELERTVSEEEYDELVDYAIELGVTNCFIQEGEAISESFIPQFDGYGVLPVDKED
ncbi:MAG: radical SAM protein [Lachnospiraceae bacterium]|nr:radical SAM protein [Lachnospiraceae bacterium]